MTRDEIAVEMAAALVEPGLFHWTPAKTNSGTEAGHAKQAEHVARTAYLLADALIAEGQRPNATRKPQAGQLFNNQPHHE